MTSTEKTLAKTRWRLAIYFSFFFALIIAIFTSLILDSHRRAHRSFEQKVTRVLTNPGEHQPIPNCEQQNVTCRLPPYHEPQTPSSDSSSQTPQLILKNIREYSRTIDRKIINFSLLVWMGVSLSAYFFINDLLRPIRQATKRQEDFLANASHELKTPVTTIKTELSVLKTSKISHTVQESLDVIANEIASMQNMIEKLLQSVSRTAPVSTKTTITELNKMYQHLEKKFSKVYAAKNIRLTSQLTATQLQTDPERLEQILTILLDNAGKYASEKSEVILSSAINQHHIKIEVCNRGLGIAPQEQDKIFCRFYRVTDPAVQREIGSGLGLAIARDLAHELKGELSLKNGAPEKTIFCLDLPLKPF